jgi:hypothetical protein
VIKYFSEIDEYFMMSDRSGGNGYEIMGEEYQARGSVCAGRPAEGGPPD